MVHTSLASQIHFCKRGKHLANCVYKPCPAALYSAVQSHCSILSHDTLCHCLCSNSSLENSERDLGHLSRYCRNCKNTSTIGFRERAYSATRDLGHLSTLISPTYVRKSHFAYISFHLLSFCLLMCISLSLPTSHFAYSHFAYLCA